MRRLKWESVSPRGRLVTQGRTLILRVPHETSSNRHSWLADTSFHIWYSKISQYTSVYPILYPITDTNNQERFFSRCSRYPLHERGKVVLLTLRHSPVLIRQRDSSRFIRYSGPRPQPVSMSNALTGGIIALHSSIHYDRETCPFPHSQTHP